MSPEMPLPEFDVPADDYAPAERVSRNSPEPKPGVEAFRDWVLEQHGGTDLGISRALDPGAKPSSRHHEGRAWDWGPPTEGAASVLLDTLMRERAGEAHAIARRAGLRVVIWQRRIWTAGTRRWEPYSGASPHTDHIHFAFSWDGANGKTSLYELTADGAVQVRTNQHPPEYVMTSAGHEIPARRTPLTAEQLAEVLAAGHIQATGKPPSCNRLGMAWAQVSFETARTHSAWNHNWGNVIKTASWTGNWHRLKVPAGDPPLYRSYDTPIAGAADYWRLLLRSYPKALAGFDDGDPAAAAAELRAAGYYTAPLERYTAGLSGLFDEYTQLFKCHGWADRLAPLIVAGAAVALTYIADRYL